MSSLSVCLLTANAKLPSRGSAGAAGYDLYSSHDCVVPGKGVAQIRTGISIACPEGTYGRIAPRSGLALKQQIGVGGGVIDADYRGEVGVILFNHSDVALNINTGDRVAQLILERIVILDVVEVQRQTTTTRGNNGFGSTGS